MDKTVIERRIKEKAEKRFQQLFNETKTWASKNIILNKLKIYKDKENNKYFKITGSSGYCPATDLFNARELIENNTNFAELKEGIIKEFEQEETDNLLRKLDSIAYFLENRID